MSAGSVAVVPQYGVRDMQEMANAISDSRLFGKITPAQAFALMLIAQAEGRHPATVAQEYDIIQDRPALKAVAALARFQHAGGTIQWLQRTDLIAEAQFSHQLGGQLVVCWTMERATKAQLTAKDNWKKFPAQMLSARVVAEGVRAVLPACLNGCYLSEEVQDFEPAEKPTPRAPKPAPRVEVQQAPPPDRVDELMRVSVLAELQALQVPRADLEPIMQCQKLGDMTVEQHAALVKMVHEIRARQAEDVGDRPGGEA